MHYSAADDVSCDLFGHVLAKMLFDMDITLGKCTKIMNYLT